MPSEFLHTFAEENPEVQKQMGCITGVFQMLDRYRLFKGRRLHKRFPSGHALLNSSSVGADCSACSPQVVLEKKLSKSSNENQGVSMESSGTSFSSSPCSSFSSLECHRSTRQEPSSMDRTSLERSMRNSAGLKNSDVSSRHIYYESLRDPSYASAQSGRQSFDFCDVVKGSIDREACSLSVKTSTKEEVKNQTLKHRDSPRLMQLSKSADRSYMTGVDGKSRLPADLSESLQVLVKLKESPWYCSEASEQPRSSCEAKDTSFFRASKEAPRFSYDGREIWCASLDPQDVSRHVAKLKELPRLSLDSREGFLRRSNFDSKPNSILKDSDRSTINQGVSTDSKFQREWGSHKCPTSVVAKLMGLEPMPNMGLACQKPVNLTETCTSKASDPFNGRRNRNSIAKSLQATQDSRKDHLSHSPKSSLKHPISWLKKSDPDDDSRLPIVTAPLRQQERIHIPHNTKLGYQEAHSKQQPESVYSEMERRLKEVEFHKSNDLRALKQIYDAMQAKGLLEAKKGEDQHSGVSASKNYSGQTPAENDHNFKSTNTHKLHDTQPFPTLMKGSHTPRANESPIVIMKPAKSVIKSGVSASSAIPLEGLSGLQRLQTSHSMYRKKTSTNNRRVKEQTSNAKHKEPTYQPLLSMDKKSIKKTEEINMQKTHVQIEQFSSRHQQSPRENNSSSVKTSGTLSPRIQERKIETEKRSCSPFSSSESNKSQRSSANRQYLESVSPRVRLRQKPAQVHQKDDQLSDLSSGKKSLSHPGDEISLRSESNASLVSQVNTEATSADRTAELNLSCFQLGSWSPSRRNARSTSSVIRQKDCASHVRS